jgi:hypothetical protein
VPGDDLQAGSVVHLLGPNGKLSGNHSIHVLQCFQVGFAGMIPGSNHLRGLFQQSNRGRVNNLS